MWSLARYHFFTKKNPEFTTNVPFSNLTSHVHGKCPRSIRIWQLMKSTERGLIVPGNGRFPCGISGLQVFVTDAARRTSSGQGEGQTAKGRLVARIPNSQEGHPVTRRVPNSYESTDSGQQSTEWLKVCPEIWQMFCAWFLPFIFLAIYCRFWRLYAILSHLMPYLAILF